MPSGPSTLAVSRRDGEPDELLVTWSAPESPNGIILNYTVYCNASDSGDGDTARVVVPGSQHSAVIMNLTPYTCYDCYVTANTSVGEGNSNTVRSVQTDESGKSVRKLFFELLICYYTKM